MIGTAPTRPYGPRAWDARLTPGLTPRGTSVALSVHSHAQPGLPALVEGWGQAVLAGHWPPAQPAPLPTCNWLEPPRWRLPHPRLRPTCLEGQPYGRSVIQRHRREPACRMQGESATLVVTDVSIRSPKANKNQTPKNRPQEKYSESPISERPEIARHSRPAHAPTRGAHAASQQAMPA